MPPPDMVKLQLHLSSFLDMQPWVICEDHELVVWRMNNWLLMYGGWTMYGHHEHCMVDELVDAWCLLVLTFDVRQMNYVWWIIVVYMFGFWYWLLMDNGCVYICLAFGTDFWWMMVVNIFIICFWILMDHSSNMLECVTAPIATKITVATGTWPQPPVATVIQPTCLRPI
jgi:hypothetical protein